MNFKTLLIYLPATDFTQPYPAIPYLAGYLRHKGENVIIKDLNIEAHQYILSEEFLEKCRQKVEQRLAFLDEKNSLNFNEQKEYMKCLEASGVDAEALKPGKFLYGFRDKEKFFDFKEYRKNADLVKQALTVISSAYFPTQIDAAEYTTPFFLSSRADIVAQTGKDANPFIEFYQEKVIPLIAAEKPDLVGISVTYPSQVMQMFAAADLIKKKFPGIHICAGGAFICRLVLNMPRKKFKTLFEYLDSIIVYEGETTLYKLILHLKAAAAGSAGPGRPFSVPNVIYYDRTKRDIIFPPGDAFVEDLDELPPPDFNGFPLDKYLSPEVVLPYAPTRGCYWGKCAFCHYGATKEGTAKYRERSIKKIVDDMEFLAAGCNVNHFAFSIDVMSPAMALNIADEMIGRKLSYRWNTELKIEKNFSAENCRKLEQGGCLSVAIGLESGNRRILELIEKGFTPQTAGEVIKNFSDAGISVQVMSFLDFPTETPEEALETIGFIAGNKEHISLFTLGNFELLPGSRVFKNPRAYGITNVGYGKGDEFKLLCLYKEQKESKSETDADTIDSAYLGAAEKYAGLEFPFAGAVSTNHTFLYFRHFGKDIFKKPDLQGDTDTGKEEGGKTSDGSSRPKLNPDIKVIEGNFSLREVGESLEKNTNLLKDMMNKSGQSHRQALHKILNKNKVFSSKAFYILVDHMKWSELPAQVKEILDLCNGENLFRDIIESKGAKNKEFIETILNRLFSLNILID